MGIVRRVRAELDSLLAPAEPPSAAPLSAEEQQEALLARLRSAQHSLEGSAARFEQQRSRLLESAAALLDQAKAAVVLAQVDAARSILRRRRAELREAVRLEQQLRQAREDLSLLRAAGDRVAAEIELLCVRQELLAAQETAARTRVQIRQAMTGLAPVPGEDSNDAPGAEENLNELELRAEAMEELLRAGVLQAGALWAGTVRGEEAPDAEAEQAVECELASLRAAAGAGV